MPQHESPGLPTRTRFSAPTGRRTCRRGASSRRSAVACSWRGYLAVDRTRWTSDRARPSRDRRHRHDHPPPATIDTKPRVHAHRTCRLRAHLSRRATLGSRCGAHSSGTSVAPRLYLEARLRSARSAALGPCSLAGRSCRRAPPVSPGQSVGRAPIRERQLARRQLTPGEHDLPELPAGGEPLVGLLYLLEREGGGHDDFDAASFDQR